MDVQDQKAIISAEHEISGVHLCHKCGWPFPNPHPSAKHRRAHKRVCGTIEGYKLIDSGSDHANLAGSDSEHFSDDERRNPSPNVDKGSHKGSVSSGGMDIKSNRSEDEFFSDAVADFSDNGVSPRLGESSESFRKSNKNAGGELVHDLEKTHLLKDEQTADSTHPPSGLTQRSYGSVMASEMPDSDIMRSERNQSEITKSICVMGDENDSIGISSTNCLESNSSPDISELIVVSDNSTTDKQKYLISSGLGTDIEGKGIDDESVDIHNTTASGVLQSEPKLEIEHNTVAEEAMALAMDKEALDPLVESDFQSNLNNVNGETSSHAGIVDEIVNQEKVRTNELQLKHDVFSQIEPRKLQDASLVPEVNSGSSKNLICCNPGQSDEVFDLEEAGNENAHSLSTANILPAEENSEDMIRNLDLEAAEEIGSAQNDKKVLVPANLQNALTNVPAGSIDISSSSDTLQGDHEKQDVLTSIVGAVGISVPENISRSLSSVPAGIVDDLKEEGVSIPISGDVGPSVSDLPIAHTSVPAQNVASSPKKVPDLVNLQIALSNVPAGSVDNSSSDALERDHEKEGFLTPIGGEPGISDPESLPSALSTVPAGDADNSSFSALEDALRKEGVSTPVGGEVVGTSVTENLPSPFSSVSPGTVGGSSSDSLKDDTKKEGVSIPICGEVSTSVPGLASGDSKVDALEGDLEKEGVSTHIVGEVGISDPESLPSVPAGTVDNSSFVASEDDLKKEGVSTANTGEIVGTSVTENLTGPLPSVRAGTTGDSSLDALKGDLKREGVSIPICWDVSTNVLDIARADLTVPAGVLDNSSSEALIDNLNKGVSTSIGGDDGSFVSGNLSSALSCVPAGVDGFPSEPLEDDLKKEGVSTTSVGEAGPSVSENLQIALSSENAGSVDYISLEALENKLEKAGLSTPSDGKVGISVPDNLPSVLSIVPAGTADNSSKEASDDDLKKEGVSIPINMEVGSSGFGVTSDEDRHLLSVARTLPAVENPETMVGDFEDCKVLKSSFSLDVGAAEEIKSAEGDKEVTGSENLGALSNVAVGSIDNSSSDILEDDKQLDSLPIDGEDGPSGFTGTSDGDNHLLSVADTSPAMGNPAVMIGEFEDYKILKSSFPLDLGAAEEIGSVENDKNDTVPEDLPVALSNAISGSIDNSSSDALEDDLKKEGVPIPIEGEIGASEFSITGLPDSGLRDHPRTSGSKTNNSQSNNNVDGSLPQCVDGKSLQNDNSEPTTREQSDVIPLGSSTGEQTSQVINLCRSENVDNHRVDKLVCVATENENVQAGDEPSASITSVTHVETIPDAVEELMLLAGDHTLGSKNSRKDFSSIDGNETLEVAAEERLVKCTHATHESLQQLTHSASSIEEPILLAGDHSLGSKNSSKDFSSIDCTETLEVAAEERLVKCTHATHESLQQLTNSASSIGVPILLAGDHTLGSKNSSKDFSSIDGTETPEVAAEERLVKRTHPTHVSLQQLTNSASSDDTGGLNQVNVDATESGKLSNRSDCFDEIPHASEVHKMGEENEVPRSSGAPAVVSELKHEDPTLSENSRPKETAAFLIESQVMDKSSASDEDMIIREITILGPSHDDHEDKLAFDNSIVSNSPTDSLEGNWGSVSVLSTGSDVTAVVVDVEVLSTDTQAAEKLDDAIKKTGGAAMECHPDKSDVFEPPSFMTLVESGVGVEKNAGASEIQTAQRDEQSKTKALQAGWFPSITNVVNESEGRKKNEEMMAKVTNWSTGKQHSPLKNLLSEAQADTKVKSPNTKQVPAADEIASKNNGTAVTTVSSILGSEMPSADTVKKEMEKEWNSPARYPIQIKKEKRKGKPYWVPFVCCTSVQQDV